MICRTSCMFKGWDGDCDLILLRMCQIEIGRMCNKHNMEVCELGAYLADKKHQTPDNAIFNDWRGFRS